MSNVPPVIVEDGQRLYSIYSMGWYFGTISSMNENQARKDWVNHNKLHSVYWKDLRAEMVLRS